MKQQLFSWAQDLSLQNKWNRIAMTGRGTFVAASVWLDEEAYNANVHLVEERRVESKNNFKSLEEAQSFADDLLRKQGFKF